MTILVNSGILQTGLTIRFGESTVSYIRELVGYSGPAEIIEVYVVTHGGYDRSFHPTQEAAEQRRAYETTLPRFMDEGPDTETRTRTALRLEDGKVFVLYSQDDDEFGYTSPSQVELEAELPESDEEIRQRAIAKLDPEERRALGIRPSGS